MHARAQPPPPRAQVGAGVDVLVLETFTFLAEIKVAARPPPDAPPPAAAVDAHRLRAPLVQHARARACLCDPATWCRLSPFSQRPRRGRRGLSEGRGAGA